MIFSLFTAVTVLLLLTGCAPHATCYTWTGDASQLPQVNLACARDMQKSYIPRIAAARTDFRGKIVGGVLPTLYKDCVEKYGYVQRAGSELGPELQYDVKDGVGFYRLDVCGAQDQTCLSATSLGWYVAPLPQEGLRSKP